MKTYKITIYTQTGNVFQSYVTTKSSTSALKEYVTLIQIPIKSISNVSISRPIEILAVLPLN